MREARPKRLGRDLERHLILLHLASRINRSTLDYRPTPKQRSTLELLRYMGMMGPMMIRYGLAKDGEFDRDAWMAEAKAAEARDLDQTFAAIATQPDEYAKLLAEVTGDDFRSEMTAFDGSKMTRGTTWSILCSEAARPIACSCSYI